jgi:hypothetical protein
MGFLDHSTNNIILDAVLTDTGRQFMSRNDGSFSLAKFALGDDEVNYNIIKKYGRTVGKEKIEKNTPVFEALTNQSQAQKYKLISVSNPNLIRLPNLVLAGDSSLTSNTVTIYTTTAVGRQTQSRINLSQSALNETSIDVELRDEIFMIDIPNLFLRLGANLSPNNIDNQQRAYYILPKSGVTSTGGAIIDFTIAAKSLTTTLFEVYGTGTSKNTIKTYVRVTGINSGAVKDIAIDIKQATATTT